MKELVKNKNLIILFIVAMIYVLFTLFLIGPMRIKNQELESKKVDILISNEEAKYISKHNNSSKKNEDDVVLLIQNNLDKIADINYINRENIVQDEQNIQKIKVNISSDLYEIDSIKNKIKEMKLDQDVSSIEIENHDNKEAGKLNYTIVFNVK